VARSTCFRLRCPASSSAAERRPHLPTAAHAAPLLIPPQAALGLAAGCGARHLRRRRSAVLICRPLHTLRPRFFCHRQRSGSRPVAVPGIFVGGGAPSSSADRCTRCALAYSATGGAPIASPGR